MQTHANPGQWERIVFVESVDGNVSTHWPRWVGSMRNRPGGTYPTQAERLASEESAGRTPKASRRARAQLQQKRSASKSAVELPVNKPRGVRISNIVCYAVIQCDADMDRRHVVMALGARFGAMIFPSAVVWLYGTTATLSIFKNAMQFKACALLRQLLKTCVTGCHRWGVHRDRRVGFSTSGCICHTCTMQGTSCYASIQ